MAGEARRGWAGRGMVGYGKAGMGYVRQGSLGGSWSGIVLSVKARQERLGLAMLCVARCGLLMQSRLV